MFQFLIGTIKTRLRLCALAWMLSAVSIPHRYDQNTRHESSERQSDTQFQFLIGTIKTQPAITGVITHANYVSIPHRYDQNRREAPRTSFPLDRVSIPHRYDQNFGFEAREDI